MRWQFHLFQMCLRYQLCLKCQMCPTCQLYQKGHRIRVEIFSSAFPKYDRNLNTGEALGQTTRMAVAQQKIYHDREHPSYVILPIVPRKNSGRPN